MSGKSLNYFDIKGAFQSHLSVKHGVEDQVTVEDKAVFN